MAGAKKPLVNLKRLNLECTRVLHESTLVPVLVYGNETMVRNPKYWSKVQAVQMDNLRGVLSIIIIIHKMRNECVREVCGVKKGVNEGINESI